MSVMMFQFRLSEEEGKLLVERARKLGVSRSGFIRLMIRFGYVEVGYGDERVLSVAGECRDDGSDVLPEVVGVAKKNEYRLSSI